MLAFKVQTRRDIKKDFFKHFFDGKMEKYETLAK